MFKFALIGNNIKSSLSPKIHYELAKKEGIKLQYDLLEINDLKKSFSYIKKNYDKINITAPFKDIAATFCDELISPANSILSVNSISFKDRIIGYSTDGLGFIEDLKEKKIPFKNKKILVLGAGGAAKSILFELQKYHPELITVINRTTSKITENSVITKKLFSQYDLLIQTTSYSQIGEYIHNLDLTNTICYDINYGKKSEEFKYFLNKKNALKIFNGEGMLYLQAKIAFYLWLQVESPA